MGWNLRMCIFDSVLGLEIIMIIVDLERMVWGRDVGESGKWEVLVI